MSDFNKQKLCYDLSLIYAKHTFSLLSPDDPYINKTSDQIDYLYSAFEECYTFLLNKPEEYFKHL